MAKEYHVSKLIGSGRYAEVFLAEKDGKKVALKKILVRETNKIAVTREIECLKKLQDCTCVVKMLDHYREKPYHAVIAFELLEISLRQILDKKKQLPEDFVKNVAFQLFRGLQTIHERNILHRDLKPGNVLFTRDGVLKLIDFGQARSIGTAEGASNLKLTSLGIGTLWYKPLEMIYRTENYGPEVDIWACGCILYELLSGKPLFPGNCDLVQICTIQSVVGVPREEEWPDLKKLKDYGKLTFEEQEGEGFEVRCSEMKSLIEKSVNVYPFKRIKTKDAVACCSEWRDVRDSQIFLHSTQ